MSNQVDAPTAAEIQAARRIARNMAALGCPDLDGMTDEELVAHLARTAEVMATVIREVGVSTAEAANAIRAFGAAMRHGMPPPH